MSPLTIRRPVDIPPPEVGKPAAWGGSNAGSWEGDSTKELPATAKALHPPTTGHPTRHTAPVIHRTPNGPRCIRAESLLRLASGLQHSLRMCAVFPHVMPWWPAPGGAHLAAHDTTAVAEER